MVRTIGRADESSLGREDKLPRRGGGGWQHGGTWATLDLRRKDVGCDSSVVPSALDLEILFTDSFEAFCSPGSNQIDGYLGRY